MKCIGPLESRQGVVNLLWAGKGMGEWGWQKETHTED